MFTPRRAPRFRVKLPARVELQDGEGEVRKLVAQTRDVSALGVALIAPDGDLTVGQTLRIAVEHYRRQHWRIWQWRGRVVHVRPAAQGSLVGIEFLSPDRGPGDVIRLRKLNRQDVVLRIDPPWSPPPEEGDAEPEPALVPGQDPSRGKGRLTGTSLAQAVAAFGFLVDQVSKTQAFGVGRTGAAGVGVRELLPGVVNVVLARNPGTLGGLGAGEGPANLLMAGVSLVMTGMVARWAFEKGRSWRPLAALGWGMLLAGMLGNLADRLMLGHVRDFLQTPLWPAWVFNLADLMAILGALALLGSWASGQAELAGFRAFRRPVEAVPEPA